MQPKQHSHLNSWRLLLLLLLIINISSYAQTNFWGMTYSGGEYSAGVIFKTDNMCNNYVVEHSFFRIESANPQYTSLVQAKDGNIYGMTCFGGSNSKGDIFCYNPTTDTYTKKVDFDGNNKGALPYGSLFEASDGILYGLTSSGGVNNKGVLFQYNTTTSIYTKKIDFDSISGSYPYGSLMQATDGMLYGMTYAGGVNNMGIIFQYNPVTSIITKKIDFNDSISGKKPTGSLLQANDHMLYGMTNEGGVNDLGVIFQYNPVTSTVTKKLDFDGSTNGSNPYGSLMQANDSMLYGVTHSGGSYNMGVLFQYNPSTSAYTKKEDFNGAAIGTNPYGSLMQATNGNLYGITRFGGTFNYGVIFQYDINTSSCITLFDFDGLASGRNSYGSLIQADDGKLYGMTYSGGESGVYGTLFQYNLDEDYFTKKLDFGAPHGKNPFGSLTATKDGMFYGMTYSGGVNGTGVFFQYNPITYTYTKKFDFSKMLLGSRPTGTLLQAMNGMLYGLTSDGGTYNMGIIFSYDPTNSSFLKEADLDNVTGYWPYGSLIQADDSMLYGITSTGGSHEAGALFQYNPFTHTCSNKFDFDDTVTGKNPYGSLMQASDGMLYGVTSTGGANDKGVLFQYDPHTAIGIRKIDFDSINGSNPYGTLVQTDDGMLYGMTTEGGNNNMGIIFQYNPITFILKKVYDFDGAINGKTPYGSLMKASNGMLYGMTHSGGIHNQGILFQYNPTDNSFTKKLDFNETTGNYPYYTNLIEINPPVGITENNFSYEINLFPNPTPGTINLSIQKDYKIKSLEIYNNIGEVIYNCTPTTTSSIIQVDITSRPNGMYLMKLNTNKGIYLNKVIKH